MMSGGNTLLSTTRETLTRFWDQTLQIAWQHDHLVLAFPLMLPDGVQAVFELKPVTATAGLLTDGGRTLSALAGLGLNLDSGVTAHLLDQRLAFFEFERDGFELRRPAVRISNRSSDPECDPHRGCTAHQKNLSQRLPRLPALQTQEPGNRPR
jgi:hypothetical protein